MGESAAAPSLRIAPDEDPYGWEAELERRLPLSQAEADVCYPTQQYRRAGGAKRTLLQWVLNLGPRE